MKGKLSDLRRQDAIRQIGANLLKIGVAVLLLTELEGPERDALVGSLLI